MYNIGFDDSLLGMLCSILIELRNKYANLNCVNSRLFSIVNVFEF